MRGVSVLFSKRTFATHKLVFVRDGQNIWTKYKKWPGWLDPRLSSEGTRESLQCGKLLKSNNYEFDEAYTSVLTRSIQCLNRICDELDCSYIPVTKTWRLNQKHYGALQGEVKLEMKEKYGDIVQDWRRSLTARPPCLEPEDPTHPKFDIRYRQLDPKILPSAQSLQDVIDRLTPLWQQELKPKIQSGKNILVVAHGNTLRAFAYMMTQMPNEVLEEFNVPHCIPMVYTFNDKMEPLNYHYVGQQNDIVYKINKIKEQTDEQNQI